jgi:hypothetical protein
VAHQPAGKELIVADREVSEFARRMATLPGVIVEVTPDAVRAGADVLAETASRNIDAATGGDSRLSRVRSGRGAAVGVEVRVRGAGRNAEVHVAPRGPLALVENDTRPHVQPYQYSNRYTMAGATTRRGTPGKRTKAKRKGYIWIPGVGARQFVKHPGTKGKRPVAKAFEAEADRAGEEGVAVFQDAITGHLGAGR